MIPNAFSLDDAFSVDDPGSGSGDHENIYGVYKSDLKIPDTDGNYFSDCIRKAINIRDVESHFPWHSLKNNLIFFSDLTGLSNKYLSMTDEEFKDAEKIIRYTKTVNSSYG